MRETIREYDTRLPVRFQLNVFQTWHDTAAYMAHDGAYVLFPGRSITPELVAEAFIYPYFSDLRLGWTRYYMIRNTLDEVAKGGERMDAAEIIRASFGLDANITGAWATHQMTMRARYPISSQAVAIASFILDQSVR